MRRDGRPRDRIRRSARARRATGLATTGPSTGAVLAVCRVGEAVERLLPDRVSEVPGTVMNNKRLYARTQLDAIHSREQRLCSPCSSLRRRGICSCRFHVRWPRCERS
jgi:hypothetical protein